MANVFDVAHYFLMLDSKDRGDGISNMKLQKLAYYAQGFHLALHQAPLFNETIEAWQHGPVVPQLYHEYKQFDRYAIQYDDSRDFDCSVFTESELDLLDEVYAEFGQFTALALRNMSHNEPPWINNQQSRQEIPQDQLRTYFATRVN